MAMFGSKVLSTVIKPCLKKNFNGLKVQSTRKFRKDMTDKAHHLDLTADSSRNNLVSLATVTGLREESKTVKSFKLKVHDDRMAFKAGQWVDMFIPQVDIVGGYSMCSSPEQLESERTLDLAVKYSTYPPALWVHTKCKENTQVQIRFGGDVYYNPTDADPRHDLLLIAGGIGINPLLSIYRHVQDMLKLEKLSSSPERVMLLYSAATHDELIFKAEIEEASESHDQLRCQFFITKESAGNGVKAGRITETDVSNVFNWLQTNQTRSYICGPSSMIADMEKLLLNQGLDKQSIFYEKWW